MTTERNAQGVDVLADLRGVVRIAKAASIGVTGNGLRIERAEAAIHRVAELVAAVADVYGNEDRESCDPGCPLCRIRAALARFQTGGAE